MSKRYEIRDIVHHCLVAFGQGVGPARVSGDAVAKLFDWAETLVQRGNLTEEWATVAPVALEKVRLAGRLAVHRAMDEGRILVDVHDIEIAVRKVRLGGKKDCRDEPVGSGL